MRLGSKPAASTNRLSGTLPSPRQLSPCSFPRPSRSSQLQSLCSKTPLHHLYWSPFSKRNAHLLLYHHRQKEKLQPLALHVVNFKKSPIRRSPVDVERFWMPFQRQNPHTYEGNASRRRDPRADQTGGNVQRQCGDAVDKNTPRTNCC